MEKTYLILPINHGDDNLDVDSNDDAQQLHKVAVALFRHQQANAQHTTATLFQEQWKPLTTELRSAIGADRRR